MPNRGCFISKQGLFDNTIIGKRLDGHFPMINDMRLIAYSSRTDS